VSKNKIRIRLQSYDHKIVDRSAEKIVEIARRHGAEISGPVPLPVKKRIYCVLRSPHVDKKSREHFEIRTHKRMLEIMGISQQLLDSLRQLELPSGVDILMKTI